MSITISALELTAILVGSALASAVVQHGSAWFFRRIDKHVVMTLPVPKESSTAPVAAVDDPRLAVLEANMKVYIGQELSRRYHDLGNKLQVKMDDMDTDFEARIGNLRTSIEQRLSAHSQRIDSILQNGNKRTET